MKMSEYLAIPAVSAGLLRTLLEECPAAAFFESPFNPNKPTQEEEDATESASAKARKERGSASHSIFLEGDYSSIVVVDPLDHPADKTGNIPDGWTNKSIRQARDIARLAGKFPILKPKMAQIQAMVDAAHQYVESLKDDEPAVWALFQPNGGKSEVTHTWTDNGVPCKIRTDMESIDHRLIVDYKTTATSAHPDTWGRSQLIGSGYYLSAAFYKRGFKALFGVDPEYKFLAQEVDPPYLCSLIGVDPETLELGAREVQNALTVWGQCTKDKYFPGYPRKTVYPELPAYKRAAFERGELEEVWTRGLGSQP